MSDDVGLYPGPADEEEAADGREETTAGDILSSSCSHSQSSLSHRFPLFSFSHGRDKMSAKSVIFFSFFLFPNCLHLILNHLLLHPYFSSSFLSSIHDLLCCLLHPKDQNQELRGGIPVRGTTVLLDKNPSSCPDNILKPESTYYHQESAIEMFKAFSTTVDKKPQATAGDGCGQRESYLLDERLTNTPKTYL